MTDTFKTLQGLILKSEGKTLEDIVRKCPVKDSHDSKECIEFYKKEIDKEDLTLPRILKALRRNLRKSDMCTIDTIWHYDRKVLDIWNLYHNAEKQTEETLLKLIELLTPPHHDGT